MNIVLDESWLDFALLLSALVIRQGIMVGMSCNCFHLDVLVISCYAQ
jgi:hypothetical protein